MPFEGGMRPGPSMTGVAGSVPSGLRWGGDVSVWSVVFRLCGSFRIMSFRCGVLAFLALLPGPAFAEAAEDFSLNYGTILLFLLVITGGLLIAGLIGEERKRQRIEEERRWSEYRQALLDFRWREDMSPAEFEKSCAEYLKLRGWKARTTKGSGDQGADVVAHKEGVTLVLQCKKHSKPIGNKAVQEVIAARIYLKADFAAVVSNQTYTRSAQDLAERAGVFLLHFTDLRKIDGLLGLPKPPPPPPSRPDPGRKETLKAPASPAGGAGSASKAPPDAVADLPPVIRLCPECGTQLRLPAGREGRVLCPDCQKKFHAVT